MDKIMQARLAAWLSEPSNENAQALAASLSRAEGAPVTRKVVISPSYGGSFGYDLAWTSKDLAQFVVEHPALVKAVESKSESKIRGAFAQVKAEVEQRFPEVKADIDYLLDYDRCFRYGRLTVATVTGPYRINEYDGAESVELLDPDRYW